MLSVVKSWSYERLKLTEVKRMVTVKCRLSLENVPTDGGVEESVTGLLALCPGFGFGVAAADVYRVNSFSYPS